MLTIVVKNTVTPLLLRLCWERFSSITASTWLTGQGHQMGANWNPAMPAAWGQLLGGIALRARLSHASRGPGDHRDHVRRHRHGSLAPRFQRQNGGFEYNAAIIVMCLCLVLGGPGPIAVDRVFRLRRRAP